jgi:hypothetical protein
MENILAMTLVFGVLLALLGALGTAANGITNGRQRTVATSLGKQAIENLQGSSYSTVAMNLSSTGLSTDPRLTGSGATRSFEGEQLVGGGTGQYKTTTVMGGITYVLTKYVTQVTPASGVPYRRITVFVEWTPSTTGDFHQLRLASLVYPLDYSSYPVGSALAEVTGASMSLSGTIGNDEFEELRVSMPSVRSTTSASTLRTAQATAAGFGALVDLVTGPLDVEGCTSSATDRAECPIPSLDAVADNDAGTTLSTGTGNVGVGSTAGHVETPDGVDLVLPTGSSTARASVDVCAACGFGDADGVPWADATTTAAAAGARATFAHSSGAGGLAGTLFELDGAWAATSALDHEVTAGGILVASAALNAPALTLLQIDGVAGFDGAVKVSAFSASSSANAGHSPSAPTAVRDTITVQVWDDLLGGYQPISITPSASIDVTATATVTVGADVVTMTSRVLAQAATTSSAGTNPRTAVTGQHSPLLLITVDVSIVGPNAGAFSLTFDYGSVTAQGSWMDEP